MDAADDLYIGDVGADRVREVGATNDVITTVLGDGVAGYSGDAGRGLAAELDAPVGVALDAADDLVVSDLLNDRVRTLATTRPGLAVSTTDGRGHATDDAYDGFGDLATQTDPMSDVTTTWSNGRGEQVLSVAPDGYTAANPYDFATKHTYDPLGDTLSTTGPSNPNGFVAGATTSYTYDKEGDVTLETDPSGNETHDVYNADDELTSEVRAYGTASAATTSYTYDGDGNVATESAPAPYGTSGGPFSTSYQYADPAYPNAVTQQTDPSSNVTSYGYDAAGNKVCETLPTGSSVSCLSHPTAANVVDYSYDDANALTATTYNDGVTPNVSYTYDQAGRRATMTDGSGTTTYIYDNFNRLTSVQDGHGDTVTYEWDADGDPLCVSYPGVSGGTTCPSSGTPSGTGLATYTYDNADRMTSVADWLGPNTTSFSYDPSSNLTEIAYPSGTTTTYTFTPDNANQEAGAEFKDTAASLDVVTSENRNGDELLHTVTGTGTWSYDNFNRVNGSPNFVVGHTYDGAGDITQTDTLGTYSDLTYNANQEPCWSSPSSGSSCTTVPTSSGTTTYGYNALGQRCWSDTAHTGGPGCGSAPANATTTTYGWDLAGSLTCVTPANAALAGCSSPNPTYATTFTYNGDGLRQSETPAGGSAAQFTWDVSSSMPKLLEDGHNYYIYGPQNYVWGQNPAPLEEISVSGSTPEYLASSQQGVALGFTGSGTTNLLDSFSPYGSCSLYCPTASNPFGFQGGYTDTTTGLVYFQQRYLDPTSQQFVSVDPLVNLTQQPYSYVSDDPANLSDPNGECGCAVEAALALESSLNLFSALLAPLAFLAPEIALPLNTIVASFGIASLLFDYEASGLFGTGFDVANAGPGFFGDTAGGASAVAGFFGLPLALLSIQQLSLCLAAQTS